MSADVDLVETLAAAARNAVLARCRAIEAGGAGNPAGITVEIETASGGEVLDATSYPSWRDVVRAARRAR